MTIDQEIVVGKTFVSGGGHKVTVDAVVDDLVYYSDEHGCHSHKAKRFFVFQYIGTAEYYHMKGDSVKAGLCAGSSVHACRS